MDDEIERKFAGHGVAIRREGEPPIPGEPLMSMEVAKGLAREMYESLLCDIERLREALEPFARYYTMNDCQSRSPDDAIEVPISDLHRAFVVHS